MRLSEEDKEAAPAAAAAALAAAGVAATATVVTFAGTGGLGVPVSVVTGTDFVASLAAAATFAIIGKVAADVVPIAYTALQTDTMRLRQVIDNVSISINYESRTITVDGTKYVCDTVAEDVAQEMERK